MGLFLLPHKLNSNSIKFILKILSYLEQYEIIKDANSLMNGQKY